MTAKISREMIAVIPREIFVMRYTLKVYRKNGMARMVRTGKIGRIYWNIQAEKNADTEKYYLCVLYGTGTDCLGKQVMFSNEGTYSTKQELSHALKCFTEKDDHK